MTPANETGAPLPEESDSASTASGVSPASDGSSGSGAAAADAGRDEHGGEAVEGGGAGEAAESVDEVDAQAGSDPAGEGRPSRDAEASKAAEADPEAVLRAAAEAAAAAEAEAQAAHERAVFDELVASFHTETAPDPVPRKIIRHPVLDVEPVWPEADGDEPDDPTVDKYFPNEHFEPPEPPPLPDTSGATKASWTLLIGGVLFLVLRTLLQWQTEEWTFWLAVAAVFGGIVSLVVRMQPDRDDYDDPDNGAVV